METGALCANAPWISTGFLHFEQKMGSHPRPALPRFEGVLPLHRPAPVLKCLAVDQYPRSLASFGVEREVIRRIVVLRDSPNQVGRLSDVKASRRFAPQDVDVKHGFLRTYDPPQAD